MKTLPALSEFLKRLGSFLRQPSSLIILGPFVLLSPVYLTGRAMFWGTPILQFVPWWDYAWTTLRAGELPLWNPLVGMGAPLLANYQSGLLYPPNWVYFILHTIGDVPLMAWGIAPMVALHLAFAGWGMYKLAKQLSLGELSATVSGLAFGLSGYLVARAHFLSITHAVAWLPWIMLAAYQLAIKSDRRALLRLTVLMAVQLLAGHAQTTWYTLLLAFVWLSYWELRQGDWKHLANTWGRFVIAGGWAGLLAAIQLVPTAEYLLNSQRSSAVDYDFALTYSFWPWRFLTLIVPNLFGSPAHGDYWGYATYWEDAIYIGLLPIIFVAVALLRRKSSEGKSLILFLVSVTTISFILALGKNTPIFPWLYMNIPTFDMFQAPARYLIWATFALSLLAGIGIEKWKQPEGRALYWSRLGAAGGFAVALGAGLTWLLSSTGIVDLGSIRPSFISAFALAGFLGLAVGLLNLSAPPKSEPPRTWWQWAVSGVLLADLLLMGWGLNAGVSLDTFEVNPSIDFSDQRIYMDAKAEETLKFQKLFRFDSFQIGNSWDLAGNVLLPNMNMLAGVASANNFDPLVPDRYARWMEALNDEPDNQYLLSRMAVEWMYHETSGEYQRIDYMDEFRHERVRWVPCAIPVQDADLVLEQLVSGEVAISSVYIEAYRSDINCTQDVENVEVELIKATTNRIAIQATTGDVAWLVLADAWYPGWHAYIDGKETQIHRADYLFRAVELPAGEHLLEFHYQPLSFYSGAAISAGAFIILIIIFYNGRTKREHEN